MRRLLDLVSSSIGKKALMAATGLLLSGFLVAHLAGNLLLLKGEAVFNHYAETLESNPLLPAAEIALAAIFLIHIAAGLRVSWENRRARPVAYLARRSAGGQTPASATMAYTGLLLIVFLFIHLKTFRFSDHGASLYRHVLAAFRNPLYAGFYVVSMAGMAVHVSHGFQSSFQTLGLNHPKYTPLIRRFGHVFAFGMLGFLALSVWAFFAKGA